MRRGDLVVVALPGDYGKPRPALVVQADVISAFSFDSVLLCPLASEPTGMTLCRILVEPTPETGLRERSEIMVEKLTAVSARRLRDVIGRIDEATMQAVERALLLVLGIGAR